MDCVFGKENFMFSSIMIFILAGLAEIGGGYFVWQWCGSDDVGSTVVKKSKILFSVLLFKKIIIFWEKKWKTVEELISICYFSI